MKIVTIINETYTDMAHNFYLQLKKFDIHKNFIVYCDNKKTLKKFKDLNLDCESRCFKPTLPNQHLHFLESNNDINNHSFWEHPKWSLLQVVKHDIVYSTLLENDKEDVILTDTDIAIFDNFIPSIQYLLSDTNPFHWPTNFLVKHYLQWKRDYSKKDSEQYGGHCRSVVNTGFMVFKNIPKTKQHIKNYYEMMVGLDYKNKCNGEKGCSNVDENIITDYIENNIVQCKEIPDWVNLLSDMGHWYGVEEVLRIKPKTYHATFTPNKKIDFLKSCGAWLLK